MFLNKCILFFAQIDSTSFLLVQLFLLPENLKNFSSLSFSCASCAAPPLLLLPQYLLCSCAGITPVPFLACIFFLRFVFSPRCFYWTVSQLLFLFFLFFCFSFLIFLFSKIHSNTWCSTIQLLLWLGFLSFSVIDGVNLSWKSEMVNNSCFVYTLFL